MAKFREAPCQKYMSEGECSEGREGTYRYYCQRCRDYVPRKGYVAKPNKKKEDRNKYHEE